MQSRQSARPATLLLRALALSAALVFSARAFAASPVVRIDGSSTVYPIIELVAQEFQRFKLNEVHVNIGVSGTHGGFAKFCRGETDLASASRPILKNEMEECAKAGVRFYELPIAYDALTVIVNPQNDFVNSLSVDELRRLWEPRAQGRINTWKDLNPAWPAQKIRLYAPGADSGSFESFTEVIVGTPRSSRSDVSTAEDHGVLAPRVAADKDAIGYLSLDYYVENQKALKAVAISEGKEAAVLPSVDVGLATVSTVVLGHAERTCITSATTLECWGSNQFGELGLGNTVPFGSAPGQMGSALPAVDVAGPVQQVSLGSFHSCALRLDQVVCWGLNGAGQLGNGLAGSNFGDEPGEMGSSLVPVALGQGAKRVAAGTAHTCALLDDGTVKCWGGNEYGQCGTPTGHGGTAGTMGASLPPVDLGP